jgi:predicted RNA methylase
MPINLDKPHTVKQLEIARQQLQAMLDASQSQPERNRLGQFATPPKLAADIVKVTFSLLPGRCKIRFLDPGFGTGSFYSALLSTAKSRVQSSAGFEIDPHYGEHARELWERTPLRLRLCDFTKADPPASDDEKFNLVICNPPYVRHHHLGQDQKRHLQAAVARLTGVELNGLSGLYCYFMVLSKPWMSDGGVAAWLIPSEFMDVNYGVKLKRFLLENVNLLRIHRFDPTEVQFDDALVSSAVVFFQNRLPPPSQCVQFSYGGSIPSPKLSELVSVEDLERVAKWTGLPRKSGWRQKPSSGGKLADLFRVKRGLATGCNCYFVLKPEQVEEFSIPAKFLRPILPSPRNLEVDEIIADDDGLPQIKHPRLLLDCNEPQAEVRDKYPTLWDYFQQGIEQGVDQRYLCRHRDPWYSQENRPAAPFLCTYMGRRHGNHDAPFRFILNHSRATAANVYLLLYPKPPLAKLLAENPKLRQSVWQSLSSITAKILTNQGRIYGGGLHKMEPKELANVPADLVLASMPKEFRIDRQAM